MMRSIGSAAALAALLTLSACPNKDSGGSGGAGSAKPSAGPAGSGASGGTAPSASSPVAATNELTFTKKDPAVGASFTQTSSIEMALDMTAPTKSSTKSVDSDTEKVDILAADGKIIMKVKVTYTAKSSVSTENGKEKTDKSPVAGKTYIVEFKDKKIVVTDENHKGVPQKEESIVAADWKETLGKPDILLSAIPGIPLKVGDKADSIAEVLRELMTSGEKGVELSGASATLKEIKGEGVSRVGVFDVKAKITMKDSGTTTTMDLSGTMSIHADTSRLASVSMSGPVTISGGGVKGEGKTTFTNTIN